MLELAARAAGGGADMVEFRLDAMAPWAIDLARLVKAAALPAVVSFRLPEDGGRRREDESTRLRLLNEALDVGAAFVDIEAGREAALADSAGGRLVVSLHDFDRTPDDLAAVARRIEAGPANVVKLATMARSHADVLRLCKTMKDTRKPTLAFAMGEAGAHSRVLCLALGAPWTYAAIDDGAAAAPGQMSLSHMRELRAHRLRAGAPVYGVIGHPVGHSLSPAMHNAAFEAVGVDAAYIPIDVASDAGGFVGGMDALGIEGLSVTIPHKVEVMAALDAMERGEVEPAARRIGAVNTIYRRGEALVGANTDLLGALDAIASAAGGAAALRGRKALVLGAGGAARAIVFGLLDAGAEVTLADIDAGRADDLARAAGARAVAVKDADPAEHEVVANATPVGMHPHVDACPLDPARLLAGQIVFDAVYNPRRTRLLDAARARGCLTVEGIEMFVRQGARQFELWLGRPAPTDAMREVVIDRLARR